MIIHLRIEDITIFYIGGIVFFASEIEMYIKTLMDARVKRKIHAQVNCELTKLAFRVPQCLSIGKMMR